MLGRISSNTVIVLCLLAAVCMLFIRSFIYQNHSQPSESPSVIGADRNTAPITLTYHEQPPYYITDENQTLTGLVGKVVTTASQLSDLEFRTQTK